MTDNEKWLAGLTPIIEQQRKEAEPKRAQARMLVDMGFGEDIAAFITGEEATIETRPPQVGIFKGDL